LMDQAASSTEKLITGSKKNWFPPLFQVVR
jgi:hypothetical protein